jgi:hypothetical protein
MDKALPFMAFYLEITNCCASWQVASPTSEPLFGFSPTDDALIQPREGSGHLGQLGIMENGEDVDV